jgi:MoaA/NifB/PqqE/SkfB family radical SAM enzyme
MNFRYVQFIGGEPFFYPYIKQLVDCAKEREFEFVEIFSNLTAIPSWIFEDKYRGINLATSFYSDDSGVHDKICARMGSFDRTVASIRKVCAAGLSLRAGFIEMEHNKGHYDRVKRFLSGFGVSHVGFDRARRFGRANTSSVASMDQLCGKCSNGNLCIDVNGDVSACIMSKPWKFGNVRHDSLDTIFNSPCRRSFADRLDASASECYPYSCEPYRGNCDPCTPSRCLPTCAPSCHPECYPAERKRW